MPAVNADTRFKILQIANLHPSKDPADVVTRAQMFMEFCFPEKEDAGAIPPSDGEVMEPGTKRKRRTKAEIEADKDFDQPHKGHSDTLVETPIVTDVPYKTVQVKVIEAVNGGKKDAVLKALKQFACANALQLKPEQYAEFLLVLEKDVAEESLA